MTTRRWVCQFEQRRTVEICVKADTREEAEEKLAAGYDIVYEREIDVVDLRRCGDIEEQGGA